MKMWAISFFSDENVNELLHIRHLTPPLLIALIPQAALGHGTPDHIKKQSTGIKIMVKKEVKYHLLIMTV